MLEYDEDEIAYQGFDIFGDLLHPSRLECIFKRDAVVSFTAYGSNGRQREVELYHGRIRCLWAHLRSASLTSLSIDARLCDSLALQTQPDLSAVRSVDLTIPPGFDFEALVCAVSYLTCPALNTLRLLRDGPAVSVDSEHLAAFIRTFRPEQALTVLELRGVVITGDMSHLTGSRRQSSARRAQLTHCAHPWLSCA